MPKLTNEIILSRVIAIEAFADELKIKAAGLRRDLARVYGSAPKGGSISVQEKVRLSGNRRKSILKK